MQVLVAVMAFPIFIQKLRCFIQDFLWVRLLDIVATILISTACDLRYDSGQPAFIRKTIRG